MALIFLLVNIGITFFVSVLAVLLILAQVLFVFFSLFLPINFIVGLLPGKSQVAYRGIISVFSYMFLQIGVSFILMITFSSSQLIFDLSSKTPLFFTMILQLILFIGVYMNLGSIGEKLGVGDAVRQIDQKKKEVDRKVIHKAKEKGKLAGRTVKAVATQGKSEVSRVVSEKSKGRNPSDLTRKVNMVGKNEEKTVDKQSGKQTNLYSMRKNTGMSESYAKDSEQAVKMQQSSDEKKKDARKDKSNSEVSQMIKREGTDKTEQKEKKLANMNLAYEGKEKAKVSSISDVSKATEKKNIPSRDKKLSSMNGVYEPQDNLKNLKDTVRKENMTTGKVEKKGYANMKGVHDISSEKISHGKMNNSGTKKE